MSCATRDRALALYVSDDLDDAATVELRRHLGACVGCRTRLEEYRAGVDWLRRRRHAPTAPPFTMTAELQKRIANRIATSPPAARWPWHLLRGLHGVRRLGGLARLPHEAVVAALAGTLLLVGAIGALQRPLGVARVGSLAAGISASPAPHLPAESGRRDHGPSEPTVEGELDGDDSDLGQLAEASEAEASIEAPLKDEADGAEVAALDPEGLRIELATRDPDVRIIWFAGQSQR